MKRKQFIVAAFLIIGGSVVPSTLVWGQKQGRIEKLLRCLIENDLEKWQKSREKIDEKTIEAFGAELGMVDALHGIWYQADEKVIANYYKYYETSEKAAFPSICTQEKVDISALRNKTDQAITNLVRASSDKLVLSKLAIDEIQRTHYPIKEDVYKELRDIRESSLADDITQNPALPNFQHYYTEFPKGKYEQQIRVTHNNSLYAMVKKSPTESHFKEFFTEESLNAFFGGREKRAHISEISSMYDDYLYSLIQKCDEPVSKRKCISDYQQTPYLQENEKKYKEQIEYLNDETDYELLKAQVVNSQTLGLIKEYLQQHKYKEFRDKANLLRTPYEAQLIWSNPTSMKFYHCGILQKSNEMEKGKNISTTYTYIDKGMPASIEITIEEGKKTQTWQTNLFYDAQNRCALEVQIDSKSKKETYKRMRAYGQEGLILSDSTLYADARLIVRKYTPENYLKEELELGKQKDTLSYVSYQYDSKGQKMKSYRIFAKAKQSLPNQVVSQTDIYEYDKYGYLTKLTFEKLMGGNEKTTGSLIYLYDEYGNEIDSNAYYEYDSTGRWIRKTNRYNAEDVERIQCVYQ